MVIHRAHNYVSSWAAYCIRMRIVEFELARNFQVLGARRAESINYRHREIYVWYRAISYGFPLDTTSSFNVVRRRVEVPTGVQLVFVSLINSSYPTEDLSHRF